MGSQFMSSFICEVCKVRRFSTMKEAEEHEKKCSGIVDIDNNDMMSYFLANDIENARPNSNTMERVAVNSNNSMNTPSLPSYKEAMWERQNAYADITVRKPITAAGVGAGAGVSVSVAPATLIKTPKPATETAAKPTSPSSAHDLFCDDAKISIENARPNSKERTCNSNNVSTPSYNESTWERHNAYADISARWSRIAPGASAGAGAGVAPATQTKTPKPATETTAKPPPKPKDPGHAYNLFWNDAKKSMKQVLANKSEVECHQIIAKKWNAMTHQEKNKYNVQQAILNAKHGEKLYQHQIDLIQVCRDRDHQPNNNNMDTRAQEQEVIPSTIVSTTNSAKKTKEAIKNNHSECHQIITKKWNTMSQEEIIKSNAQKAILHSKHMKELNQHQHQHETDLIKLCRDRDHPDDMDTQAQEQVVIPSSIIVSTTNSAKKAKEVINNNNHSAAKGKRFKFNSIHRPICQPQVTVTVTAAATTCTASISQVTNNAKSNGLELHNIKSTAATACTASIPQTTNNVKSNGLGLHNIKSTTATACTASIPQATNVKSNVLELDNIKSPTATDCTVSIPQATNNVKSNGLELHNIKSPTATTCTASIHQATNVKSNGLELQLHNNKSRKESSTTAVLELENESKKSAPIKLQQTKKKKKRRSKGGDRAHRHDGIISIENNGGDRNLDKGFNHADHRRQNDGSAPERGPSHEGNEATGSVNTTKQVLSEKKRRKRKRRKSVGKQNENSSDATSIKICRGMSSTVGDSSSVSQEGKESVIDEESSKQGMSQTPTKRLSRKARKNKRKQKEAAAMVAMNEHGVSDNVHVGRISRQDAGDSRIKADHSSAGIIAKTTDKKEERGLDTGSICRQNAGVPMSDNILCEGKEAASTGKAAKHGLPQTSSERPAKKARKRTKRKAAAAVKEKLKENRSSSIDDPSRHEASNRGESKAGNSKGDIISIGCGGGDKGKLGNAHLMAIGKIESNAGSNRKTKHAGIMCRDIDESDIGSNGCVDIKLSHIAKQNAIARNKVNATDEILGKLPCSKLLKSPQNQPSRTLTSGNASNTEAIKPLEPFGSVPVSVKPSPPKQSPDTPNSRELSKPMRAPPNQPSAIRANSGIVDNAEEEKAGGFCEPEPIECPPKQPSACPRNVKKELKPQQQASESKPLEPSEAVPVTVKSSPPKQSSDTPNSRELSKPMKTSTNRSSTIRANSRIVDNAEEKKVGDLCEPVPIECPPRQPSAGPRNVKKELKPQQLSEIKPKQLSTTPKNTNNAEVKTPKPSLRAAKFPVGCPVWFNMQYSIPCARYLDADRGVVKSVSLDISAQEIMYEIERKHHLTSKFPEEVRSANIHATEYELAFAVHCPVYVQMEDREKSEVEGKIINVRLATEKYGTRKVMYTVMLTTGKCGVRVEEGVGVNRVRYQLSLEALQSKIRSTKSARKLAIRSNDHGVPFAPLVIKMESMASDEDTVTGEDISSSADEADGNIMEAKRENTPEIKKLKGNFYKGLSSRKHCKGYDTRISVKCKKYSLGHHKFQADAALAYDEGIKLLRPSDCKVNFNFPTKADYENAIREEMKNTNQSIDVAESHAAVLAKVKAILDTSSSCNKTAKQSKASERETIGLEYSNPNACEVPDSTKPPAKKAKPGAGNNNATNSTKPPPAKRAKLGVVNNNATSDILKRKKELEFQAFVNKHRDETFRLLKASAARGESSVPTSKMAETRARNLLGMKAANSMAFQFGGTRLTESELTSRTAKAEGEAVQMYVKGMQKLHKEGVGKNQGNNKQGGVVAGAKASGPAKPKQTPPPQKQSVAGSNTTAVNMKESDIMDDSIISYGKESSNDESEKESSLKPSSKKCKETFHSSEKHHGTSIQNEGEKKSFPYSGLTYRKRDTGIEVRVCFRSKRFSLGHYKFAANGALAYDIGSKILKGHKSGSNFASKKEYEIAIQSEMEHAGQSVDVAAAYAAVLKKVEMLMTRTGSESAFQPTQCHQAD